ncbi:hypothetical protein ACOPJQ_03670 [Luteimonas dalianensis]|uniref:hypothetical protein n=1 Tax=Luteimonas dalianensis TaxID=1148196 RepID=UPI003BF0800E
MRALLFLLILACLPPLPAIAQQRQAYEIDLSGIDAAMVLAGAEDVILRAGDRDVDGLYQVLLDASRSDEESRELCRLFDPSADRSLAGLQRAANALGPQSRVRFADAVLAIAMAGMQNPLQPYDPAAADQVLRRAGVTAMLIHEGFSIGIAATGDDPGSREARCRSFRQLVDVLQDFELHERAAATRYLMLEGLTRYGREL